MIDLHIHTSASSDGQHTPQEIFEMAREIGLKAIAFTDHNSIDNVEAGLQLSRKYGIEFIPSVEIDTYLDQLDIHILGYFINHKDEGLKEWLYEIIEAKKGQAFERFKKLKEIGFVIDFEDVLRFSEGKIATGLSYLKAILSREENLKDPRIRVYIDGERSSSPYYNFYRDYIKGGKPAFVPSKVSPTPLVIDRIKAFGGIPILAHPMDTRDEIIHRLIEQGLMGLEVYTSYHSPEQAARFLSLTKRLDLLATAGSDFHGVKMKPDIKLGQLNGDYTELLQELKRAHLKMQREGGEDD